MNCKFLSVCQLTEIDFPGLVRYIFHNNKYNNDTNGVSLYTYGLHNKDVYRTAQYKKTKAFWRKHKFKKLKTKILLIHVKSSRTMILRQILLRNV